jgi:DNA-binding NarL/FixJ family response regulator
MESDPADRAAGTLTEAGGLNLGLLPGQVRRTRWSHIFVFINELTDREREVFVLLGHGHDNRTIAAQLSIGERTVKHHITAIMHKLGVTSRLQAGLVAAEWDQASFPKVR